MPSYGSPEQQLNCKSRGNDKQASASNNKNEIKLHNESIKSFIINE